MSGIDGRWKMHRGRVDTTAATHPEGSADQQVNTSSRLTTGGERDWGESVVEVRSKCGAWEQAREKRIGRVISTMTEMIGNRPPDAQG